jgi:hypothetical protein
MIDPMWAIIVIKTSQARSMARGAISTRFQSGINIKPRPRVDDFDVTTVRCIATSKDSATDAPTRAGTDETDPHATRRHAI